MEWDQQVVDKELSLSLEFLIGRGSLKGESCASQLVQETVFTLAIPFFKEAVKVSERPTHLCLLLPHSRA